METRMKTRMWQCLGLGDLFSDVGSPSGRPEMVISQLLLSQKASSSAKGCMDQLKA